MRKIHLVVCDLFLPADIAGEVCAGLRLPSLEKMLSRSVPAVRRETPPAGSGRVEEDVSLEALLCEIFGVPHSNGDAPIAPISASFDGLGGGCWLRADPVYLSIQRDEMILLPDVQVGEEEAVQLCAALNEHFAGQGMEFFAPHPQRWYLRVERLPDVETVPLLQAAGRDVHGLLPKGAEELHWHRLFNEIQMLLFSHPVNEAREARGELPVNSVWFWGGGCDTLPAKPADCGSSREAALPAPEGSASPCQGGGCTADVSVQKNFDYVGSDEELTGMFASSAGVPFSGLPAQWNDALARSTKEKGLLVWTGLRRALQRGDLHAWRTALQDFETGYVEPLWRALRTGKISQLELDILAGGRRLSLRLNRSGAWAFWRPARPLPAWSGV